MPRSIRFLLLPLVATASLTSCGQAPPPDPPNPPNTPAQNTELRDTIQKPIDRAKSVEGIIMKSHDRQDQQLQNDEGASSSSAASDSQ